MNWGLVLNLALRATLELEWSAPASCPTVDVIKARLGTLAGRASCTITERPSGYLLNLRVNESARVLEARSCEEAVEAAILILQLGLQPAHAESPADEPIEPNVEKVVTPAPGESPQRAPPWHVHLNLSASALVGWVPQPMFRAGIAAAFERSALVLLLSAQTGLPQQYTGTAHPGTVSLHLLADTQAGACWSFSFKRAGIGPCLAAGAAFVLVEGRDVAVGRSTTVVVAHGGPGARLTFRLADWLSTFAAVWGRLSARPSISFQGFQPVVEASLASVEFSLGAGGVF